MSLLNVNPEIVSFSSICFNILSVNAIDPAAWDAFYDILLAGSLTTFALSRLTLRLFYRKPGSYYTDLFPPTDRRIAAFLLAHATFWACLFGFLKLTRWLPPPFSAVARLVFILVPTLAGSIGIATIHAERMKRALYWLAKKAPSHVKCLAGLSLIGIMFAAFVFYDWVVSAYVAGLIIASPLISWPFISAVFLRIRRWPSNLYKTPHPAQYLRGRRSDQPRVICMVFDELDQKTLFEGRPHDVWLPQFGAFAEQSIVCRHAVPPCRCTEISMPAYFTGRLLTEAIPRGPTQLDVLLPGQTAYVELGDLRNIFQRFRDRDLNCGFIGWYHPVGRLFGHLLVDYCDLGVVTQESAVRGSLMQQVGGFLRSAFETPRHSVFGLSMSIRQAIKNYTTAKDRALAMVGNSRIDIAFLHFPVPHSPFIYDRRSHRWTSRRPFPEGYLDNLVLADELLGEIVTKMVDCGSWDASIVIVTSDHWWRKAGSFSEQVDLRVPMMIHFPGQRARYDIYQHFNTVILHDILLACCDGEIADVSGFVRWLSLHAEYHPPTKGPDA